MDLLADVRRVCSESADGTFEDIGWFNPRTTDSAGGDLAARLELAAGRPNPFSARTSIAFDLPHAGRATLVVYDVSGRLVKRLLDSAMPAGRHAVTWDATDDRGARVTPGVYFYRLNTDGAAGSRSVVYPVLLIREEIPSRRMGQVRGTPPARFDLTYPVDRVKKRQVGRLAQLARVLH